MTAEFSEPGSLQLPQSWRSLWRAHCQGSAVLSDEDFTLYVRAGNRELAHDAVRLALRTMLHLSLAELEEAYDNLTPARELVLHGVSERPADRLFEVAWQNEHVKAWVSNPVFLVPDAAALFAAWVTAQLDHSSQHATIADMPIGRRLEVGASSAKPKSALRPLRYRWGFQIPGKRLKITVAPAGCDQSDRIQVSVSATAESTGLDRGAYLAQGVGVDFLPDEIKIDGDVLHCATFSAPGLTDYREGFSVTLESGQANAVHRAVADVCRVLNGFRAGTRYLGPWLSAVQVSSYEVEQSLYDLAILAVLDGLDHVAALEALEEGRALTYEVRQRLEDPHLWKALNEEFPGA